LTKQIAGALLRYRVMALITGTVLLFNCVVAVPLQIAGHPGLGGITWTIHGGLFIIYCLTVLDLGVRVSWSLIRIVLVGLAGTIPVVTFVAERWVTRSFATEENDSDELSAVP
jgi:integral membrane protein